MKKTATNILKGILLVAIALPLHAVESPQKTLLPEEFKVYYNENVGISSKAFKGGTAKVIPTSNSFEGAPGCYVACYSKNHKEGVYPISDGVYLMGQIRVAGQYMNGLCIPKGFENKDMRQATEFKEKCEAEFPDQCANKTCWVGGQTANWF